MDPEFDCEECGNPLDPTGNCLNIDCTRAQEQAARGASRETKKATASHSPYEPRAFTSAGRVD